MDSLAHFWHLLGASAVVVEVDDMAGANSSQWTPGRRVVTSKEELRSGKGVLKGEGAITTLTSDRCIYRRCLVGQGSRKGGDSRAAASRCHVTCGCFILWTEQKH